MTKFLKNAIMFLLQIFILITLYAFILPKTKYYFANGSEIYHSIFKSKQKNGAKIIVLGDSVGNQLFPNTKYNDSINSLTCNQAIGMVGHYILLKNYLDSDNRPDTVFLISIPGSFKNNLHQIYTFHYFLKPFYNEDYTHLFSKTVEEQVSKIPYNQFCNVPYIWATNWAPDFSPSDVENYHFLSPISLEYLTRIKNLSTKYKFNLTLLPPPLALHKKELVHGIYCDEIVKNNLENDFKFYFEDVIYLDSNFFNDGIHLRNSKPYTVYYENKFMK